MNKKNVINISALIESRDSSTGKHVFRVSRYTKLIVAEMKKLGYYSDILTKNYIKELVKFASLHDIGKIFIPDSILTKPDKLTEEEFEIMKRHTQLGGEIVLSLIGKRQREMAYNIVVYHHEKWNGKGYPMGLSGEETPLCARIVAIADVFDAISADRCYRKAMPLEECFDIIEQIGRAHV